MCCPLLLPQVLALLFCLPLSPASLAPSPALDWNPGATCTKPSTPYCWSGHCPASAHSALAYLLLSLPHHSAGVHAEPGSRSYQSCGTLEDRLWLCPHPHSSFGGLPLPVWWGGLLCLATHPVPLGYVSAQAGAPWALEGTDNTIRSHDDNQEGHGGDLATSCPLLPTGREGVGAQKQPHHFCQPSWPCPGPTPLQGTVSPSGCCSCCWSKGCIGTGGGADTNWQHLLLPWPVQLLWPGSLKFLPPRLWVHKEGLNPKLATHHNTLNPQALNLPSPLLQ